MTFRQKSLYVPLLGTAIATVLAAAAAGWHVQAQAQSYPVKPLRVIVQIGRAHV